MYRYRRVIIFERNSTIEVAVCHHENNFIQRRNGLGMCSKYILYRCIGISAKPTKTPVCNQLSRSEYELKNEYFFHGLRHR